MSLPRCRLRSWRLLWLVMFLAIALFGAARSHGSDTARTAAGPEWVPLKGIFRNGIGCTWNNGCARGYPTAGMATDHM